MFVFVKFVNSIKFDRFGPATPGECESWMKIKKIHPVDNLFLRNRLLLNSGELTKKQLCE